MPSKENKETMRVLSAAIEAVEDFIRKANILAMTKVAMAAAPDETINSVCAAMATSCEVARAVSLQALEEADQITKVPGAECGPVRRCLERMAEWNTSTGPRGGEWVDVKVFLERCILRLNIGLPLPRRPANPIL